MFYHMFSVSREIVFVFFFLCSNHYYVIPTCFTPVLATGAYCWLLCLQHSPPPPYAPHHTQFFLSYPLQSSYDSAFCLMVSSKKCMIAPCPPASSHQAICHRAYCLASSY